MPTDSGRTDRLISLDCPPTKELLVRSRASRTRLGAVGATAGLVGGLLAVLSPSTASAAPGEPIQCDTPTIVASHDNGSTQLSVLVQNPDGTSSYHDVGAPSDQPYNALAYNPADGFLYADSGSSLVRIDSEGNVTTVIPNIGIAANNGTISNGVMYLAGTSQALIAKVDLATQVLSQTLTDLTVTSGDFVMMGGFLWGQEVGFDALTRIDPNTGHVELFPGVLPDSPSVGAAFSYGNGNLGLIDNASGRIYQVAITDPGGPAPTFDVVAVSQGPAASNADATSCVGNDQPDLGITKTAPIMTFAGGPISWDITVQNHGPGTSSGHVVSDPVPSDVTDVATSDPACTVDGNEVTCVGGVLSTGDSHTYHVTGTAPNTDATFVNNTATVLGNEVDPSSANNSATGSSITNASGVACTAVGLRLGVLTSPVANKPFNPCVEDSAGILEQTLPLGPLGYVKASVLTAHTGVEPGLAAANAEVASVEINLLGTVIKVTGIHTNSVMGRPNCSTFPTFGGTSYVAGLTVNNKFYPVHSAQFTLTLPLLGKLVLNQKVNTNDGVGFRGLFLDLPGTNLDLALAESAAAVPCPLPAP
jgi:uncharacterized repeat protein (TIGR01451 family)